MNCILAHHQNETPLYWKFQIAAEELESFTAEITIYQDWIHQWLFRGLALISSYEHKNYTMDSELFLYFSLYVEGRSEYICALNKTFAPIQLLAEIITSALTCGQAGLGYKLLPIINISHVSQHANLTKTKETQLSPKLFVVLNSYF